MTIDTDPYDYLVLNIINSDDWRYRPTANNKIMKTLPVNDDLRYAIYFIYPEIRKYFQVLDGSPPYISFKLKDLTVYLNRQPEAYGRYSYYLTQEEP